MSGIALQNGTLVVDREANALDELAIKFSSLLCDHDIEHVFIAGYVAILTGRARATDDIDVLIQRLPESEVDKLAETLRSNGYWGPAMPLESMHDNLSNETNIWIAPDDQLTPHLEAKFPTDEFDRASLANAIDAQIGDATIPVGPLELQIAYKLYLGGQKDLEDAAHLYTLFGESLRQQALEKWVQELDVHDMYERLREI